MRHEDKYFPKIVREQAIPEYVNPSKTGIENLDFKIKKFLVLTQKRNFHQNFLK